MAIIRLNLSNNEKLRGDIKSESIDLSDFLTVRGLEIGDISNAIIIIRKNSADETDLITKTMAGGQLTKSGNELIISFDPSDWASDKMLANLTYFIALGVEYNGTKEEILLNNHNLKILQDFISDW